MSDPQGWSAGAAPPVSAWTAGPAPTFTATNEPPSPSLWERANTPLVPQIADAANAIADHLDKPRVDRSALEAQLEGFIAGATQGAGKVLGGFTSPLGLALTVAGLGPSGTAAKSVPMVGRVLALPAVQALQTAVRVGAGGAFAAHGAQRAVMAENPGDVAQGVGEMAAGALGMAPVLPSGPQLVKGLITGGKLIKSPVRTTIGIIADELARRNDAPPDLGHVSAPGYPREGTTPAPPPGPAAAPGPGESLPGYPRVFTTPPVEPPPPVTPPPAAAPTEFQAAQAARATNSLPDQKALNEAALAARRAAYQASQQPAADAVVKASGKLHFTAPEWAAFRELRARGVGLEEAATGARAAGQLARQFGSPTTAEAAADIARRNASRTSR